MRDDSADSSQGPHSDGIDAAIWRLIGRHLAGEASPADDVVLQDWIAADPERPAVIAALRAAWGEAASAKTADAFDSAELWAGVRSTIRRQVSAFPQGHNPQRRTRQGRLRQWSGAMAPGRWDTWLRFGAVAAAVVVALSVGVLVGRRSDRRLAVAPTREYVTANGERATVTLVDGTRFALAPGSRLRVPLDYGLEHRAVTLEGEALFTVVHDRAHPFSVRTGKTVATDVGTRFDVRGYPTDSRVRVVVAEGAVSFRVDSATPDIPLHAGDLAVVDAAGKTLITKSVDAADYTDWSNGRLKFVDTPLDDALADVGRWYGLDVRLADTRDSLHRLNATFVDKPITGVLDAIAAATGLFYSRSGRTVVFTAHAGSRGI